MPKELPARPEMSSADFDALMVRLYPLVGLMRQQGQSRPLLALAIAQHLWIHQSPESEDTAAFRAHMLHLEREGWFDFTDFRTA